MKQVLNLFICLTLCLQLSGCGAIAPSYNALPKDATTEAKLAALKADARAKAADPAVQAYAKTGLILGGNELMARATSGQEQADIAELMYFSSTNFKALLLNENITLDQVEAVGRKISAKFSAQKYVIFIETVNGIWMANAPMLKLADDAELLRTWVLIIADAAEKVGNRYRATPVQ